MSETYMSDTDKKPIAFSLLKKYNLEVYSSLVYDEQTNRVKKKYWFNNKSSVLDKVFIDSDFLKLNLKPENFAYLLFCYLNIKYSHENEFYID